MDFDFKKQIIQESLLLLKKNGLFFQSTIYQGVLRLENEDLSLFCFERGLSKGMLSLFISFVRR